MHITHRMGGHRGKYKQRPLHGVLRVLAGPACLQKPGPQGDGCTWLNLWSWLQTLPPPGEGVEPPAQDSISTLPLTPSCWPHLDGSLTLLPGSSFISTQETESREAWPGQGSPCFPSKVSTEGPGGLLHLPALQRD